jgi:hypothetical protein
MQHNYPVISWRRAANSRNREFLNIAPTPHNESCTPAGWEHIEDGQFECAVLIDQMIRIYGEPPEEADFFICSNDHEAGNYCEAAVRYTMPNDDMDYEEMSEWQQAEYDKAAEAEAYAMKMEGGIPDKWDEIALKQLQDSGHYLYAPKAPGKVVKHQGKVIPIKSETA